MVDTSKLKSRTIQSLWWSAAENFGVQFIQFIIIIILARQLFPEDYGLIAMLAIFIAIAQSFVDSGFGSALIQKQDATQVHYSSIFFFNILMGILMAGLLCLSAPYIAEFYKRDILIPLTYFLSLNLIVGAFGAIQTNLLTKNLDFKTQTKVSILAVTLSGVIGISLAVNGFGVWSLAVQSVSSTLFRTLLLWLFNKWRPSLVFNLRAIRELFSYGSWLLVANLLDVIFINTYQMVIGKLFPLKDLGFYTQAKKLEQVPSSSIATIVGRVSFPLFSMIQDDPVLFKNALKKAVCFLVMINFPIMVGLAACAKPLIILLLTEKWALSIPYLQLFCISGLLYPLHVINLNVLRAKGRSDIIFWLEIIKIILIVANITLCYRWGILAIVYGQVILSIVAFFLNSYYTSNLAGYSSSEQIKDFTPYLLIAGLMGALVFIIPNYLSLPYLPLLVIQVIAGIVIYFSLCRALRLEAFMEAWSTITRMKGNK